MRELNLAELRSAAPGPKAPQAADIARFKDEGATAPRVVAASQGFIVYSLKNRSSLRVLPRIPTGKGNTTISYKRHTANVLDVSFVNSRSNVAASTSENEMLVWFIKDEEIFTYFSFPVFVPAFAWVPVADRPPDLILFTKKDAAHDAAILRAGELILASTRAADGSSIEMPDGKVVADTSSLTTLRGGLTVELPLIAAASPLLAFSASDTTVVTASLSNRTAPAWAPCDGGRVTAMALMQNETMVATCDGGIFFWDVAGEPVALQRISTGPRRSLSLHTTSSRVCAMLSTAGQGSEAVVFTVEPKRGASAFAAFEIPGLATKANSAVVPGKDDEPRLHVDTGSVLQVYSLQGAAWTPLDGDTPVDQKKPTNAQPASPPAYASNPAPARTGALAALGVPANPEFDGLCSHIDTALANTSSMLGLSGSMIAKDHEGLLDEALRAQARAIAAAGAGRGAGGASNDNTFDAVLDGIADPVAMSLVDGISNAIEEHLRKDLESALMHVLTKQEKRKQKDQMAEIRSALDGVVSEVMSKVQDVIREKQTAYASRLIHYVSDVAGEGGNAVQQLQQVIAAQQQQLAAITQSGLIEEVKALREQVKQLQTRGSAAVQPAAETLEPETILANARRHLAGGEHDVGLNWVLQFNDPSIAVQLLTECDEDRRSAMLEDSKIADATWVRLAGFLASAPKRETLEATLSWLCDIAYVKKDLVMNNNQLAVALGTYVEAWKSTPNLPQNCRTKLRELFMAMRK